jgi:cardiolipin synthase
MDSWILAFAAAVIHLLGWVCALHALLHKTRHTTSAIAWILTCLLVPLLGSLLYITVGQDHLARRRSADVSRSRTLFRDRKPEAHLFPPESTDEEAFVRRIGLATLSNNPLVGGNAVDFRIDGEAAYPLMLEAIKNAGETITWSYYIFDGDSEGRKFRDALIERARAGVNVRVLYDAVGSLATHHAFWKSLLDGGVKVKAFLPRRIPWRLNLRNHRKLLIVDGKTAFTGSMNVGERHLRYGGNFISHDIVVRVRGPVVNSMQRVFARDWFFACGENLDDEPIFGNSGVQGDTVVQVLESGPDEILDEYLSVIVSAIHHARKSITLVTPYFVPDETLLSAMLITCRRDVAVRLVIPEKSNKLLIDKASRNYTRRLVEMGAEIYERPGTMVHMKIAVIDNELVLIGSSNLDNRSLFLNFEMDLVVPDTRFARDLEAMIFHDEIEKSIRVTEQGSSRLQQIVTHCAAIFAPIL